jgi:predicted GNAT family acetyltransferase
MIRQLVEDDRQLVLNYLEEEPAINLFLIGDIEIFGFDKDAQRVYGEFIDNELRTVILNYKEVNVIVYSKVNHDFIDVCEFIKTQKYSFVSGAKRITDIISKQLINHTVREMYFCERNSLDSYELDEEVLRVSSREDVADEYDLLITIKELTGVQRSKKEPYVKAKYETYFEQESGINYFIRENGKMVSTAATTAETTTSAMVIGVGTHSDYRGKGYATRILKQLINEYNKKNKTLCLFYDNPKAGEIYKRLGFKDIDKWVMIDKEETS